MKLLHTLSIDDEHYVLVFDNNSPSNYNRFIAITTKSNKKEHLHGCSMKTSSKKEYKEKGLSLLKSYKSYLEKGEL